jgi:hypothetical protein
MAQQTSEGRSAGQRVHPSDQVARQRDPSEIAPAPADIQTARPGDSAEVCIFSVLPGLQGTTAIYFPAAPDLVVVEDMPLLDGRVDVRRLAARIAQFGPTLAVIGCAAPQPRGTVQETFRFGVAYGAVCTTVALSEAPTMYCRAGSWKPSYGLAPGPSGRQAARILARQLFPASAVRFADDVETARAEAALLARWASERITVGPGIGERKS